MAGRPGAAAVAPFDCGVRRMLAGFTAFAERRRRRDFGAFNFCDTPAAFPTPGIGAVVTLSTVGVGPPRRLHGLLRPLLTVAGVAGSPRVARGMLPVLEYRDTAHEDRIEPRR